MGAGDLPTTTQTIVLIWQDITNDCITMTTVITAHVGFERAYILFHAIIAYAECFSRIQISIMAAKPDDTALDESVGSYLLELLDNYGYGASVDSGPDNRLEAANGLERDGGFEDEIEQVDSAASSIATSLRRLVEVDGWTTTVRENIHDGWR